MTDFKTFITDRLVHEAVRCALILIAAHRSFTTPKSGCKLADGRER